ncbi:MAG: HAMP domain-containing protein [Anaerolineales bacterium]|nr:MAG: HAMP domain-containing protein [Anaerolineales bacterium]
MLKSWRTKLVLSLLALIVLAMSLSGVLLLSFLEQYFLEATEESLLAQARITAQALIPGALVAGQQVEQQSPLSNTLQMRGAGNIAVQTQNLQIPEQNAPLSDIDLGYLSESTFQLGAQLETRIRILDTAGNVLVDSADAQYPGPINNDPLVVQALNGQYAKQTSEIDGINTMSLAMPVLVEGELVGVIYLSHPLRDIEAVLRDMRARWISATAIALALSGGAGLILSSAITRPLRNLTSAAGAVAQGHFDHQVQVRTQDEMGQLSRTFNDMTARLRAARQMQIDFVANVSHELRTPLTAVKGMVETLRAGAMADTSVRDRFLSTVESETDRMIRLVNDLLILTRADSQALNLEREPVDIAELARKTVARIAPQAQSRGVSIIISESPGVPLAWADRDRVAQVMLNLLDNAVKYSHAGGTVKVNIMKEDEETAWIQVQDQGIGIPADVLPRIGERFYRADKARARANGGSGLGLAIAQTLITAHGGRLWLESQEGEGTTANLTLPAA